MADISKISINGTTYDIKDTVARTNGGGAWGNITGTLSNQTDLQSALDGKVSTSGDNTLTGKLTFQNLQHDVNSTTLPSVNTYGNELYFKDIAGNNAGWITTAEYAEDGGLTLHMQVKREVNGVTCNGLLGVGLTSTGVETYTVHSPSAFRDTIDAVCKSGDTMTGNLSMIYPSTYNHQDNNIDPSTPPSGYLWDSVLILSDKNGNQHAYIRHTNNPSDQIGIQMEAMRTVNNSAIYNGVVFSIDANGNKIVNINAPEAWKSALGSAPWISRNTTKSIAVNGVSTSASAYLRREGNVVTFSFYGNINVTTANSYYNVGAIPSGYRPTNQIAFYASAYQSATLKGTGRFATVNDTHTLYFSSNVSGGPYTFGCCATWITADS